MLKQSALLVVVAIFNSCATALTPIEFNTTLPTFTQSKFISPRESEELMRLGKCKCITRNRTYIAPMGLTIKDDMKNGAKGIDDWVKLDGGNAYILRNYQWIVVGDQGASQLHLEFDTMLCQ